MKIAFLLTLLVVACIANEENDVIVGTDATFDAILAENDYVLVEFCE